MNPRTLESFRVAFFVLILIILIWPRVTEAQGLLEGVSGVLEFNYSFLTSKTKDAAGVTTKTDTSNYNPRFTLNIDTKIFPNLKLHAGGIAELIKTDFESGGIDTKTTLTRFRPYIDLTLETPLYTAGLGYIMRQEKTKTADSPSITLVNEEYNAMLGWRPEGLPYIDMRLKRSNNYDEDKLLRDIQEDSINLTSRYTYKGLQLNYYGSFLHTMDDLNNLDVKQLTHSGRVSYGGSFFNRRVSVNTTYDIFHQEVKTTSEGTGFVTFQVFPVTGRFALDNSPIDNVAPLVPNPALPALVDGNLTVNAGIDIGLPAPGEPTDLRNVELEFLNVTDVSQLLVWIDRDLSSNISIANSFSWDVYVSANGTQWNLYTTISPAPFGPFQNRFELNFPSVGTRFIKVVVSPLSPAVPGASGFPDIFITELQAFRRTPAADVEGKTERTSHIYNLDVKARILDNPSLFYDFYYFFNKTLPEDQKRFSLSNGFSVNHRFSRIFSGTARVAREDGEEEDEKRVAYVYNASITADPLRTLRNSLVFSGRNEEIEGKPNNTRSIFLYNTAQLYQGVDVNLSGGLNFSKQETGEKARDIVINLGANIVPHRTMTLGLNYSDTMSRRRGGAREASSTYTRRVDFNVNYNPFRTLYIFTLIQVIAEEGMDIETIQNYSVNWSPFPNGALQFNLAYNENLRSEDNAKERNFIPSVRWNITKRSYIDLSYQVIRSKSELQKTNSQLISSNLKIFF